MKEIYEGKIINLRKDKVLLENNEVTFREVIEHNGGVEIALENDDGKFFLVNQFRYGPQKNMLEFPAGAYVIIVLVVKSLIKSRVLVLLQKIKALKINNLCVV